jgi:hypothetical protein
MSNTEEQYIQQTMTTGSLSLALSRVAEQKVQFPKLREFSRFEVAEQETVADVLASLLNPAAVSGEVKSLPEAEVEQHLGQQDRQVLQKLRAAKEVQSSIDNILMRKSRGTPSCCKFNSSICHRAEITMPSTSPSWPAA